jgi:predicted transglutaminase-like cysteine proteinase
MQTDGTAKCGAEKMPGVGRAPLRERLPHIGIGRVFAAGIALLLAPASAQSSIQTTYIFSPPGGRAIQVNLRLDLPSPTNGERKISPLPADTASLRMPAGQPFELSTTMLVRGEPLVRIWQGIQAGMRAEMTSLALCHAQNQTCSPAAQKLDKIISDGRSQNGLARIGVINRAVNMAIKPADDPYGWRSPLEALSVGEGDCKDYAVMKYFALLEAGLPEQDVKLLIVHDVKVNQVHAIVAARFDGDWIILDNRWLALVRDLEMHRAIPLYALDGNGVSRFSRQQAQSTSPAQPDRHQ